MFGELNFTKGNKAGQYISPFSDVARPVVMVQCFNNGAWDICQGQACFVFLQKGIDEKREILRPEEGRVGKEGSERWKAGGGAANEKKKTQSMT